VLSDVGTEAQDVAMPRCVGRKKVPGANVVRAILLGRAGSPSVSIPRSIVIRIR